MKRALLFLMALTLWPGVASAQTNASVRLALIAPEPALRPALDLLTVELSQNSGIALLERAEIERVLREQSLAATSPDYLKLGQVLGADGLLVAEIIKEGATNAVALRLVAVKPGVVLGSLRSPWPVADVGDWVKGIPGHFAPLLPKLGVLAKDAVPISVVNLRAAVSSRETRELEQQLTLLAIERLTRERELFVLERRRLDLLSAEKELKSTADSAFWNGSYLLDGVIDRDGYSKERVTLNARLVPPAGGVPLEMLVTGPRTNLASVVEQLTAQVLQTLKRGSSPAVWQPEAEAEKYFEEAQWTLRWGMTEQAQSAADAAWALGKQDLACAIVRLTTRVIAAAPDTGGYKQRESYIAPASDKQLVNEPMTINIANGTVSVRRANKVYYSTVGKPPKLGELDQAQNLLELYAHLNARVASEQLDPTNGWYRVGIEALETASQVLQHFHVVPEAQHAVQENLARLRAEARLVAATIAESPAGIDTLWAGDTVTSHQRLALGADGTSIQLCTLRWGGYWQDRPEAALPLLRELAGIIGLIRQNRPTFLSRELCIPPLAAWNKADRNRLAAVWEEYLRNPSLLQPSEGTMNSRSARNSNPLTNRTRLIPDAQPPLKQQASSEFGGHKEPLRTNSSLGLLGSDRSTRFERVPLNQPTTPVANVLLVERFFPIPQAALTLGEEREQFSNWYVLEHRLHGDQLWLDVRFKFTYLHYLPNGSGWRTTNQSVSAVLNLKDMSWEVIRYPEVADTSSAWELMPTGGRKLARDFQSFHSSRPGGLVIFEFSEVFNGNLYVSEPGNLKKYDRKARHWETQTAPWQSPAARFGVGSRLFAANSDTVHELLNGAAGSRILASCRRRPAVSSLDSLDSFDDVKLFAGPDKSLRALIGRRIFSHDGRDWKLVGVATNCIRLDVFEDAALLKLAFQGMEPSLWLLPGGEDTLELCLRDTAITQPPGFRPLVTDPLAPVLKSATWISGPNLSLRSAAPAIAQSNLFVFVEHCSLTNDATGQQIIGTKDGRHADLIFLKRGDPTPVLIPLKFDLDRGEPLAKIYRWGFAGISRETPTWLVPTADWLLLGQSGVPGVWAIPRAHLESTIEQVRNRRVTEASVRSSAPPPAGQLDRTP